MRHPLAAYALGGALLLGLGAVSLAPQATRPVAAPVAAVANPAADITVVAAGDICGSNCKATAAVVGQINPSAVLTAGDNAYDSGTLSEYRTRYDPTWGKYKTITYPSPGNHEYNTSKASGYFDYFNGVGVQNGRAGDRSKGYYDWEIGSWKFIALNSNFSKIDSAAQLAWLKDRLRTNTKQCVAAYWHHPLFTLGSHSGETKARPLWQALYDAKADLVLVGHDHNYQRFAPQSPDGKADPAGLRQVLVGTGGKSNYNFSRTIPNVEAKDAKSNGVLKLTLSGTGYKGDFVPVSGQSYKDSFTGSCHAKG
ncbi:MULTISPECIES: metallophosphoesterase [unclassified Crossiella]|uniref:metallophosphoesterase family protein n=1 Tax=unclassified Crossiella TaxID=2620835 RepID=UPI001FFE4374|nr:MULTISPECIES: metallophosphoesterase [unclassified Crossiella]MCK2245471.1 metallophosphoesterase [Crossiella sp. S99.2]MCK2259117.1 metallophosphoesterase [Crossiella sp. S99.1]